MCERSGRGQVLSSTDMAFLPLFFHNAVYESADLIHSILRFWFNKLSSLEGKCQAPKSLINYINRKALGLVNRGFCWLKPIQQKCQLLKEIPNQNAKYEKTDGSASFADTSRRRLAVIMGLFTEQSSQRAQTWPVRFLLWRKWKRQLCLLNSSALPYSLPSTSVGLCTALPSVLHSFVSFFVLS